jgi:hypothetical protein
MSRLLHNYNDVLPHTEKKLKCYELSATLKTVVVVDNRTKRGTPVVVGRVMRCEAWRELTLLVRIKERDTLSVLNYPVL